MTARWINSLDEEVDLDNIDREYALNILTMVLLRRARRDAFDSLDALGEEGLYVPYNVRQDELVQKLRDVILNGRDPSRADRARAVVYNYRNRLAGKPFRAPIR